MQDETFGAFLLPKKVITYIIKEHIIVYIIFIKDTLLWWEID